jgi:hypothetical protein|tara:strand:+ start:585 stop:761 length:177 start_codon:yes stop_codon:yes gene_type:complete
MTELQFHVYENDKSETKVVAHSLSVDELEDKLKSGKVKFGKHEVVPVWEPPSDIDASY